MSVTTQRKANATSEQPTAVYGAYNTDGQIIYVGISNHPRQRWTQHECGKPWAEEVAEWRTLAWYPNRAAAKTQETFLIQQLRTRWNLDESPIETEVAARYLTLYGHIPGYDTPRKHRAPWPLRLLWWLTKTLARLTWTIITGTLTLTWNLATIPLRPHRKRRRNRKNRRRNRRR